MRKAIKRILLALLAIIIVAAAAFTGVYFTRLQSMGSIQKLTAYEDYNLYRMDVKYDYDLDKLLVNFLRHWPAASPLSYERRRRR